MSLNLIIAAAPIYINIPRNHTVAHNKNLNKCLTFLTPAYSFTSLQPFKNDAVLSFSVLERLTLYARRREY